MLTSKNGRLSSRTSNLLKKLLYFYLVTLLHTFSYTKISAKPNGLHALLYNTSSGTYQARLIKVDNFDKKNPQYVHRLTSVPYAEKPERFQFPTMKSFQSGIHGEQEPVFCYQSVNITSYGLFSLSEAPKMSEDCLRVNLYIPVSESVRLENLPVIVHIHGGSNMVGGASLFDGSLLASYGKVIVAFVNFRLSVLGFLSDMTTKVFKKILSFILYFFVKETNFFKYPGNYGLRDQILAIRWIKQNCYILNCDPNAITLW